jgi:RNA polymerase sigma-70 factor (ECF subfamily)
MTTEAARNEALAEREGQTHDPEVELVRLAKARSQEAWTEIYETNHAKLFRYVLARVADHQTAEDLTAAVFVGALKGIDSYVSRGKPILAWLYTIARNTVNYHHRAAFRRGDILAASAGVLHSLLPFGRDSTEGRAGRPPAGDDPSGAVDRLDLQQALTRLSADQRDTIVLRYYVGLTIPEVACVLGKRERAVYSLHTRAIKALRRHLG